MSESPIRRGIGRVLPAGLAALAVAAVSAAPASAQGFRFRTAATRVIVDVLVLDEDGNPVPGLTPDDFELLEEGERQRVLSLDVVDWERYGPSGDGMAAGDRAPAAERAAPADEVNASPRRFVIVFNRRRADPVNLRRAKRGLEEFVANNMVEGDETMILEFANEVRVLQEFWPGKEQTLASVRQIVPGTYSSFVPEADARESFQMLSALAEALEAVPGRKIVVLLSSMLQTFADSRQIVDEVAGNMVEGFPGRSALDETNALLAAIQQLNHANATLYSIDIEGVYGNENNLLTASQNSFDSFGNDLGVMPGDDIMTRMNIAANVLAEGGNASLAVATGGAHFPNQTNFAVALNRIGVQNELYYLLSFSPSNSELDGSYRRIEVRVPGDRDLRVIARPGYFARERRGEIVEATARGDYGYAFPESVHSYAYLLNPRPDGAFAVLTAALPESYVEEPGTLRLQVTGEGGTTLAEAEAAVDPRRFWVGVPVELPSGTHEFEIRVERGGRAVHAVATEFSVPAGLGSEFTLSSVFPFVAEAHQPEAIGPPVRPVAVFAPAENARVAFFILPGDADPPSRVQVAYEVLDELGEVVVEAERPDLFELDPTRREGTPVMLPLQTAGLRAGRYTAVVRVTDDRRDRTAAGELEFFIR